MTEPTVRQVEPGELAEVEKLFDESPHAFRRVWLKTLSDCSQIGLLFAAPERGRMRGVLGASPQNARVSTLCAAAFTRREDIPTYLPSLVQRLSRRVASEGATLLTYVGTEDWLLQPLLSLGFTQEDEVITLLKTSQELPPVEEVEGITVRSAREADLGALVSMDSRAFPPEWHYGTPIMHEAFHSSPVFILAEREGAILGYAYGDVQQGAAHVTRLAVDPEYQRHGIGACLLSEVLSAFYRMGVWWITLNTQRTNTASQKLYHQFGFQVVGQAVPILVKPLNPERLEPHGNSSGSL